jgi:hypothetical protein
LQANFIKADTVAQSADELERLSESINIQRDDQALSSCRFSAHIRLHESPGDKPRHALQFYHLYLSLPGIYPVLAPFR